MARANNLPILATELLASLAQNQGKPMAREVIAASLTATTATGAIVSETDVSDIAIFIRETIPDLPLVSSQEGLQLAIAWKPN